MKALHRTAWAGLLVVAAARLAAAQPPPNPPGPVDGSWAPAPAAPDAAPADAAHDLAARQAELEELRRRQAALKTAPAGDDQKKQIELLQKEVETLEKLVKLLADQIKKQPGGEAMQGQAAALEVRSVQAAHRDQELADAVDDLRQHQYVQDLQGPWLPPTLKQFFDPGENNETPLSIYGQFLESFSGFNSQPGKFSTPDFSPYFLLQLNDQFLLEANIDISNAGVSVAEAQVDWFLSDHATLVVGRYLTPIGFFNERLNHEWINKAVDVPILFQQVSPLIDTDGVQLRGSSYLGCWPVKVEYSAYAGNGMELPASAAGGGLNAVADLGPLVASDEVNAKALGGRLGFWAPEWGLHGGASGYLQNGYSPGDTDHLNLWGLDAGWHKDDWDFQFEFAHVFQQANSFIGSDVRRTGWYAQLAYRPWEAGPVVRNVELVGTYSQERFHGIDPTQLDFTGFSDPRAVPVDRNQWIFGINYYLYASTAFKFGYEVNHELGGVNLHDNAFLAQFVWSF